MTDKPLLNARKHSERPHVLIISDDVSLATFLNEGLPLGGFWTTVIASGLQALEVFRLRQFDIIALDYGLRSFDAIELVKRLRGYSTRAPLGTARTTAPIVLISESEIDIDPELTSQLGISRALSAPLELEELAPELHQVFEDWQQAYPSMPISDDPLRENR